MIIGGIGVEFERKGSTTMVFILFNSPQVLTLFYE